MMKVLSVALVSMFVLVGCGADYDSGNYDSGYDGGSDSVDPDIGEYSSLQSAWDDEDIETQASVCVAIEYYPDVVISTAIENNVDPDIAEAFFEEVCP